MQVSARYLLERCSVVAWLQQMASPTNSLDIDTTQSNVTLVSERAISSTPMDLTVEDGEPEGEDVAKDVKCKDRSVVIRSKVSVLLAAPPRLLARVLCLMRRTLGAIYLLSADASSSSSNHLQQILLAIVTLIDVRHLDTYA